MSSQGARNPREEEEKKEQEEDFYDCEENLELPGRPEGQEDMEELEDFHIATDKQTYRRDITETEGGLGGQEEDNRLQKGEEAQDNRLQEEAASQDSRLQEEETQDDRLQEEEVEMDDDYLREVEKELTEEEKEGRRQQSLTLKEKGNSQFKAGDWSDAERSYTEALVLCPVCFSQERAVLFSNRAAARLHLDLKQTAITDCTRATELNPDYVRAWLRRAELHEQTEKLDEALEDYKKVLDLDPTQTSARQACMRLPQQIQERNEKLKEELMSKLKDLGNLVLRPFGLSTSNFEVNQDANTGSYSVNFIQNPNNNNR